MKSFLRENPTIAFGLGLPLLLVVVFLLISGIPALLVAPPQYDVLYATGYNNYPNGVQISVVNRKVRVVYQGSSVGYQRPHLWRYSPKTGGVQEIPIMLPPGLAPPGQRPATPGAAAKITQIDVPDLDGLTIDSSSVAPDGYRFSTGTNGYSGDVFTGLFYGARYNREAVLTKQGRSIRLPNSGNRYYSNNTRFIGWVVTP
jgi:ABC-type dipeptide/oligopeptide/nickel transport system permease subunit